MGYESRMHTRGLGVKIAQRMTAGGSEEWLWRQCRPNLFIGNWKETNGKKQTEVWDYVGTVMLVQGGQGGQGAMPWWTDLAWDSGGALSPGAAALISSVILQDPDFSTRRGVLN